jgi:hypothetical protein
MVRSRVDSVLSRVLNGLVFLCVCGGGLRAMVTGTVICTGLVV